MSATPKPINIVPVLNGFVATVGCQTLVYGSVVYLCSDLKEYLTCPEGVEKRFRSNAMHRELLLNPVVRRDPPPPQPYGIAPAPVPAPAQTCDCEQE